jgi:hypothetical protein
MSIPEAYNGRVQECVSWSGICLQKSARGTWSFILGCSFNEQQRTGRISLKIQV